MPSGRVNALLRAPLIDLEQDPDRRQILKPQERRFREDRSSVRAIARSEATCQNARRAAYHSIDGRGRDEWRDFEQE